MAQRYLRADGNWNGSVWATTSGGTAGTAATPTTDDDVFIVSNFTVTLTADSVCANFNHLAGTLDLDVYKLTVGGVPGNGSFWSSGPTTRTLSLGGGHLHLRGGLTLESAGLTLATDGDSLVTLEPDSSPAYFDTGDQIFDDVRVILGFDTSSTSLEMTGSPTFRMLDIRSANSQSHTVIFGDGDSFFTLDKLVAIGASTSARLKFRNTGTYNGLIRFKDGGNCYGQFLDLKYDGVNPNVPNAEDMYSTGYPYAYAGSNSIGDNADWRLENPPKIDLLIDPLTTALGAGGSQWFEAFVPSTMGTPITTGVAGGGVRGDVSAGAVYTTLDSFDLVDSAFTFERPPHSNNGSESSVLLSVIANYGPLFQTLPTLGEERAFISPTLATGTANSYTTAFTYPTSTRVYERIALTSAGALTFDVYSGGAWSTVATATVPTDKIPYFRSVKPMLFWIFADTQIGSVGLTPPPTSTGNMIMMFLP